MRILTSLVAAALAWCAGRDESQVPFGQMGTVGKNPHQVRRPAEQLIGSIEDLPGHTGRFFIGNPAQSLRHVMLLWRILASKDIANGNL